MDRATIDLVWRRADGCCEYCQFPSQYTELPFEIDHIIAKKHHGQTVADNLALSFFYCNSYKGPNIAGIDIQTGNTVVLFHPRKDNWNQHFQWEGPRLAGVSSVGRATIDVLRINHLDAIRVRESMIVEEVFPPRSPWTDRI